MDSINVQAQAFFPVLQVVLLIGGIFVVFALFSMLRNLSRLLQNSSDTMVEAEKAISELRGTLMPILEKIDVSVDALNAQLLRLDGILTAFEAATQKVTHTSEAVSGIVATPVDMVAGFTDKLRRGWKTRRAEAGDIADGAL